MNHSGKEVETKILDTTLEQMLPKLKELGFQHYFEGGILKAQWLINPANGKKLRVRQEGNIVKVEHKEPIAVGNNELKANDEKGFEAKDFNSIVETLLKIGLERVGLPSIKRRVSYVLDLGIDDRVRLDFDTYTELMGKPIPEFMEIESNTSPPEKAINRVYEYVEKLGFQHSDCRKYGPAELFAHYYPGEEII